MRLLVTRPEPDASDLAARLADLGHDPLVEPLSFVEAVPFVLPPTPFAGILLTSRHGVAALAGADQATALLALPVWCVGEATAAAARAAGFADAKAVGDNALALANSVIERCDPGAGPLLYPRGQDVRGDLAGRLGAAKFTVFEVVVYAALARSRFSSATRRAFKEQAIDGVVLMSQRAAVIFARLVEADNLSDALIGMTAYCLSPAVAEPLVRLGVHAEVAAQPTLAALVTSIGEA